MKKCSECGMELPDDAKFCGSCGKQLPTPTETAKQVVRETAPKLVPPIVRNAKRLIEGRTGKLPISKGSLFVILIGVLMGIIGIMLPLSRMTSVSRCVIGGLFLVGGILLVCIGILHTEIIMIEKGKKK